MAKQADWPVVAYTGGGSTDVGNLNRLRALYQGYRDTQLDRIRKGNRLVANFYNRLGVAPGTKLEELKKKELKIVEKLKAEHKMISAGLTSETGIQIKKAIKRVNPDLISDQTDYALTDSWIDGMNGEKKLLIAMESELGSFDIWNAYLKGVPGIGPSVGSTIISILNIRKAQFSSSFHKYVGVDTLNNVREGENRVPVLRLLLKDKWPTRGGRSGAYVFFKKEGNKRREFAEKSFKFKKGTSEVIVLNEELFNIISAGDCISTFPSGRTIMEIEDKDDSPLFTGLYGEGRSRRTEHQEMRPYTDKDGNTEMKKGLTYNPKLKTVLVGVLSDLFIKKNPHYNQMYHAYKNRIKTDERRIVNGEHLLADGHITKMAYRYIIKIFLINLWVAWKFIEDLPIERGPYHMEKMNHSFHIDPHFNPVEWVKKYGRNAYTAPAMVDALERAFGSRI